DADGEPSYEIYGDGIATVVHALSDRVEQAIDGSAGLFISSNTLVGDEERAVSMRARELALSARKPVIFDPHLRLHRWPSPGGAPVGLRPPTLPRARTPACRERCWCGRRPTRRS